MLDPKRAAANSVSFLVTVLLVTGPESKCINKIGSNSKLPTSDILMLDFLQVVLANLVDFSLKSSSLLVFLHIVHALKLRIGRQEHILVVGGCGDTISLIAAQPCLILLRYY